MGFTKKENIKGVLSQTILKMIPDKYISLPDNIIEARKAIEGQNFDIIVYCELGMLMKPLYLSYARLAPLQITTWGHSETSGIDTIDYYVSSKLFDVEEDLAKEHYSEKLYLMDSLSTYYYPPTKILLPSDHVYKSRKDYKLDDNMNIYGCIQSSFKISDDFEKILDGILKADPNARILMSYSKPYCRSQIQRIISKVGEKDFKRIMFLPSLDIINYMNLINLTDVILDPYPFGGCNTSFEAFDLDIPVVTMPTKYLNGRFTFGMYKKMGFIDMVADSPQSYIKLAVKTATDKTWRAMIKEKINKTKHLIFQEKASINEWSDFLYNTYKRDVLGVF
jgi:predicted O-linked N-acetylglucosamine transferase (SPINDLY family)